jgi:hypothetical protein
VGIVFWIEERIMFKVGQKIWDVVRGEGVVVEMRTYDSSYPVVAEFSDGRKEVYTREGKENKGHKKPSLYPYPVAVMRYVSKPSIDWEHVRGEYKFLAQDIDGNAWLYWEKPELGECGWQTTRGECAEAQQFASYTPGTCDWKDSLVERP